MKGTGKYFDGKKPLSHSSEWEYLNNHFVIRSNDSIIASWPVDVVEQDLDQNTAYVIINKETGERLEITGDHSQLPKHLVKRKKVASNGKIFAAIILFLGFTIYELWNGLPFVSRIVASQISPETEKSLANIYNLSSIGSVNECIPSQDAQNIWNRFLSNITTKNDDAEIMIAENPMINAFTLPGRKVVLLSGLLKNTESPEELAGILAHELGHVHHKHIIQKIINALLVGSVFQFVSGDFTGAGIDPSTIISIGALSFDRGMESEADNFAFERLELKQVNPYPVQNFFKRNTMKLDKLSFLSSHPGDEERMKRFRQKPRTKPVPLMSEKEWQVLKTYCDNYKVN